MLNFIAAHLGACVTIAGLIGSIVSGTAVVLVGHEQRHTRTEVLLEQLAARQERALELLENWMDENGGKND